MPSIIAAVFCVITSLVLPLGILVFFLVRRRPLTLAWLLGCLTFLVSQVLIRLPLLALLRSQLWYSAFETFHPIPNILLLSFTAGIFEECGRWLMMRLAMKKRLGYADGIAFGIGHGGFEAIWLVGLNSLLALILQPIALMATPASGLWLTGAERLFAILAHMGLSLVVMKAVREKKALYLLLAICLHGLFNFLPLLAGHFGAPGWAVEALLGLFSFGFFVYIILAGKKARRQATPTPERMEEHP